VIKPFSRQQRLWPQLAHHPRDRRQARWVAAILALCLLGSVQAAFAQSRPVPTRKPVDEREKSIWAVTVQLDMDDPLIGLGIQYVPPRGVGMYGTLWLSTSDVTQANWYYPTMDIEEAQERTGGDVIDGDQEWFGIRLGLTKRISTLTYVYAGAGIMRANNYLQIDDRTLQLSTTGNIWVNADEPKTMKPVVEMGAVFYTRSGIAFLVGLGSHPIGIVVGLGFGKAFG